MNVPKPSTQATRQVIYIMPPTNEIDKYAYAVCRAYSEKYGENCTNTEFVQGFKVFVRAIAKATTNRLNRGVSNASETRK